VAEKHFHSAADVVWKERPRISAAMRRSSGILVNLYQPFDAEARKYESGSRLGQPLVDVYLGMLGASVLLFCMVHEFAAVSFSDADENGKGDQYDADEPDRDQIKGEADP
jgi:hypothetical protein